MECPRILSIQSHVVSGYVGNKSAVFPMQLLGFDVDNINSVQFSNHTGYKHVKGQILTEKDLADIATGLQENNIDTYTHMLTGYIGSPGFLKEIANVYTQLKKKNPDLIYVCDPAMGDNGHLYAPKELIPLYKDLIIPIATILVPNLYETELLTGLKIDSVDAAWEAIRALHQKGCKIVCISSAELAASKDKLYVFASSITDKPVKLLMELDKIDASFTGSGDLFSALLLCFMHETGSDLKKSLEKTVAVLQSVLRRTFDYVQGKGVTPRNMELRLIQSRDDILAPSGSYKATIIDSCN